MYYDVVVIGLGISGLYFGLKSLHTNKSILFLEKSNRIGGRLISLKIDDTTPYYAEGGAQRFFTSNGNYYSLENDNILLNLLQELNIGYTTTSNDKLIYSNEYVDIYKNVKRQYPYKNRNISFPSAITLSNSNTKATDEFALSIGYDLFKTQINIDMAYNTIDKITSNLQNFVNNGFDNLCKKIFEIIKTKHHYILNYGVKNIIYNCDNKLYKINNEIYTKKIIYTGTIKQLYDINFNMLWIEDVKKIFKNYFIEYSAIKIFIKIKNPFWTKEDYFKKINSDTLLNQILIFNHNTIQIYSNMENAKTLYNLDKYNNFNWINPSIVNNISTYIKNTISIVFNRNIEIYKIAYKYNDVAVQFSGAISNTQYEKFNELLNTNNFHFISGDYTDNPGWVNSCLYSVESNLHKILN